MPGVKPLPASVRYLKARLKILKRPSVWLSSAMFMVALALLVEYWNHPHLFEASQLDDRRLIEAEPSASEPATLMPLDPYSSVDEPAFGDTTPDTTSDTTSDTTPLPSDETNPATQLSFLFNASNSLDAPQDLEALLLNPLFTSTSTRSRTNPSSQIEWVSPRLPNSDSPDLEIPSLDATASESTNQLIDAQPSIHPLQAAIERNKPSTNSQPTDSAQFSQPVNSLPSQTDVGVGDRVEQSAPFPFPQPANSVQVQPLPGQPSHLQTQPYPQFLPQTSPSPGTTGYTLPPALRTPVGVESIDTHSTGYRQPAVPPAQPALPPLNAAPEQPAPFSVPRAVPGRSIGGGEINTFSNP